MHISAGWWFGTMEFYDFPFSWEFHNGDSWWFIGNSPTKMEVSKKEIPSGNFPFSWEFHHPNWRTPSFFRGVGINHQPLLSFPEAPERRNICDKASFGGEFSHESTCLYRDRTLESWFWFLGNHPLLWPNTSGLWNMIIYPYIYPNYPCW